jgi:hypothetical protein
MEHLHLPTYSGVPVRRLSVSHDLAGELVGSSSGKSRREMIVAAQYAPLQMKIRKGVK